MRRARCLSTFLAVTLLVSRHVTAQTSPPRTSQIEIDGDTVRFVTSSAEGPRYGEANLRARYGFVRSSGLWVTINRPAPPEKPRVPESPDKPLTMMRGWRLAERGSRLEGRVWHAIVAPDRHEYPIAPSVDSTTLRSILTRTGATETSFIRGESGFPKLVQSWRVDGSTVWIGTVGNWAALVAFDTTSRTMRTYTTDWVANAIVRSVAVTRHAVWLSLRHPSDSWGVGLARFDRDTHRWSLLTPSATALPDSEIIKIEGRGDTLWVATENALAVYDDRAESWNVRWFRAVPRLVRRSRERDGERYVDSVVRVRWELIRQREPNENATRVVVDLAQALEASAPGEPPVRPAYRPDSFLAIARSLPDEQFARAYRQGGYNEETGHRDSDIGLALAHPRLVPFTLLDTLRDDARPSRDELRAIGLLSDRALLPYVHWASSQRADEGVYDATAAWTRARLGDTTWLPVLRDFALERGWLMTRNQMADALLELGDTVITGRMLGLVTVKHQVWPYGWLQDHISADRWRGLVREAANDSGLVNLMLLYYYLYATREETDDATVRPELLQMVHAALVSSARDSAPDEQASKIRDAATYFADHFRDAASIPLIIPLLTTDDDSYLRASSVLFHLTAVDSVPGSPKASTVERRQVRAFWERWWVEHGPSFVPADRVAGEAAEARWWRRRR